MRLRLLLAPLALLLMGQGCLNLFAPSPEPADGDPIVTPHPADPSWAIITTPEAFVSNLTIPWDIAFLPNREMLVTERTGRLLKIGIDGTATTIEGTPEVRISGEGGLLGVLPHPDFATNNQIYLYVTATVDGKAVNHIERNTLEGNKLTNRTVILDNIPGSIYHDGGRMAFGPDGKLYVTVGDATDAKLAQDRNSLAGKILRLNEDGSIPSDNPFGNATWSYGHRNPQGLAWDTAGRLWATEHGRSGATSGYDELNLIEKGKNYGWPTIEGPKTGKDMEAPALQSGPTTTWAPASALFWDGSIFFGGLRGEAIYEAQIRAGKPENLTEHFKNTYGRIRTIVQGPDGLIYFTTSNRDGRGTVKAGDDKIFRVDPTVFRK